MKIEDIDNYIGTIILILFCSIYICTLMQSSFLCQSPLFLQRSLLPFPRHSLFLCSPVPSFSLPICCQKKMTTTFPPNANATSRYDASIILTTDRSHMKSNNFLTIVRNLYAWECSNAAVNFGCGEQLPPISRWFIHMGISILSSNHKFCKSSHRNLRRNLVFVRPSTRWNRSLH